MPLAPTLQELKLGGNKLGGMISDEIVTFTKLTKLDLANMGLEGAFVLNQFYTKKKRAVVLRGQAISCLL